MQRMFHWCELIKHFYVFPPDTRRFEIDIEVTFRFWKPNTPNTYISVIDLSIVIQTAWQLARPFQIFFALLFRF